MGSWGVWLCIGIGVLLSYFGFIRNPKPEGQEGFLSKVDWAGLGHRSIDKLSGIFGKNKPPKPADESQQAPTQDEENGFK